MQSLLFNTIVFHFFPLIPGRDVKCPNAEEVVYTLKEKRYYDQIEKAYSYASKLLLDLLIDEKELLARIRY